MSMAIHLVPSMHIPESSSIVDSDFFSLRAVETTSVQSQGPWGMEYDYTRKRHEVEVLVKGHLMDGARKCEVCGMFSLAFLPAPVSALGAGIECNFPSFLHSFE